MVNSKIAGRITHSYIFISLGLLPVWWVLGLDQFIWPMFAVAGYFLYLSFTLDFTIPKIFLLLFLIIAEYLLSISFITERIRYLTFIRNYSIFIGGVLTAVLIAKSHHSREDIIKTVLVIVIIEIIIAGAGFLALFNVNVSFTTPVSNIIPDSINSNYLKIMITKSFYRGYAGWFRSRHIRPVGLMLYPNLLAGIAAMAVLLKIALWPFVRKWARGVLLLSLCIDFTLLVSSLSRSAWVGFGSAVFLLLLVKTYGFKMKVQILGLLVVVFFIVMMFNGVDMIVSRLFEKGHSNQGRLRIYFLSLHYLLENPLNLLFGYGTQIDHPLLGPPMGSHSTYLGIMFKQGLVSLLLFSFFIFKILKGGLNKKFVLVKKNPDNLYIYIFFAFVVLLFQAIFIEIDVDTIYAQFWWILLGLCLNIFYLNKNTILHEPNA